MNEGEFLCDVYFFYLLLELGTEKVGGLLADLKLAIRLLAEEENEDPFGMDALALGVRKANALGLFGNLRYRDLQRAPANYLGRPPGVRGRLAPYDRGAHSHRVLFEHEPAVDRDLSAPRARSKSHQELQLLVRALSVEVLLLLSVQFPPFLLLLPGPFDPLLGRGDEGFKVPPKVDDPTNVVNSPGVRRDEQADAIPHEHLPD